MYFDLETTYAHKMRVYELIYARHKPELITLVEGRSLEAAARAIEEYHGSTQEVHILDYVGRNAPYAYLFRDAYTMRALRAGLEALERKEEEFLKQCIAKTNSQ